MQVTDNYSLPQFVDNDVFNKGDINKAFLDIDTAVGDMQDVVNVMDNDITTLQDEVITLQTVITGNGVPTSIPTAIGKEYLDTTNKKKYVAFGTVSSADWIILN